jgi:4'-phosphopantetheinyl transferase EntD
MEAAAPRAPGGVRSVIERIVPESVAVVATRGDVADAVLFPEEERALGRAVEKRRREYTTARACARRALARLGLPEAGIPTGDHGEPLWPTGVVGSLTHCDGYRACALARTADLLTVGIDAEPNAPLPDGLVADIARPEELAHLSRLARADPDVCWDRLLFSAKEAVYKAWFPLTGRWLGFEDATLDIDPTAGTFSARLLVDSRLAERGRLTGFSGRWIVRDRLVATAIAAQPFGRRTSASGLPAASAIAPGGQGPNQLSRAPSIVMTAPE